MNRAAFFPSALVQGSHLRASIESDDTGWKDYADSVTVVELAVAQVADYLLEQGILLPTPPIQPNVDIVLGNDQGIELLNRQWRGKDRPTNVLSFPSLEVEEMEQSLASDSFDGHCGDIYLALQTIERESLDHNKPFAHHLQHLTIHALLHIFGYDHEEPEEAEAMEAIEISLLQKSGIANPYELTPIGSNER